MIRPLFLSLLLAAPAASCAQQGNVPRIESSDCIYKADSLHKTHCGFLIVPENRHHPRGQTIKLPFIYVESNNPAKSPDPVLYTGGGPGVSSLHPVTSIARRSLLRDRDYIAPTSEVRLPAGTNSVKRAQRTNHVQNCAFILALEDKLLKTSNLIMVEAAGVEPASEIAVSRENPCSVRFRGFHSWRSERTRCAKS